MNNNRLGCLTGTGLIAALITLFALVGVAFASGGHMFSSGDLNNQQGETLGGVNFHAEIQECRACHTAPWEREVMAERCIVCHTEIAAQMLTVAELHGAITQKSPTLACRDCHPEHRGKTASLTELGKNEFPHTVLGYSLEGHQRNLDGLPFECADCHTDDVTNFASDSCLTCHRQVDTVYAQIHLITFGEDCLACHDGIDSYGDDFDHDRFSFPLTGKHSAVDCGLCHINARTVSDLRAAPQDCYTCHSGDDPHQGRYGATCESCHSSEGWTPANFDHNLSAFKLEGEHAEATCEECHANDVYKGTSRECYSCHAQDDDHNGQYGTDCSVCHTPFDWESATFDHNRTKFPLTDGHARATCEQCHSNGVYQGTSASCVACHGDPTFHAGAFGWNCTECHTTSAWLPARFKLPHPQPQADDEGSGVQHGGASCRACHPSTVYQATCVSCHEGNNFDDGDGGGEDEEDD
jgi:hypothetical protein